MHCDQLIPHQITVEDQQHSYSPQQLKHFHLYAMTDDCSTIQ